MFSGIIEALGTVQHIEQKEGNLLITIKSTLVPSLTLGQSIAHDGVCLSVSDIMQETGRYVVTAVQETIINTSLKYLQKGQKINLEQCVPINGRLDGHIVQGHIDAMGICTNIETRVGSWVFRFSFLSDQPIVEKGSIAVNGVSLTCYQVTKSTFLVSIIPMTFYKTTFHSLKVHDYVNLEFDIIGKYISRLYHQQIK